MGRVYSRKNSPFWWIAYVDAQGVEQRQSSKCRAKAQAKALLVEIEAREQRRMRGLEPASRNPEGLVLREVVEKWMAELPDDSREQTTSTLRKHVLSHRVADEDLEHLTTGALEDMRRELLGRGLSAETTNKVRTYLTAAINGAIRRQQFFGENPAARMKRLKHESPTFDFLTTGEILAVLESLDSFWAAFFALGSFGCMRRDEIRTARWGSSVSPDLRTVTITKTKSKRPRRIPLVDLAQPFLRAQLEATEGRGLIFPSPATGKLLHKTVPVAKRLRDALETLGIEKNCRFHDLRHSGASILLMGGVSLPTVQDILGHSSPKITSNTYAHTTLEAQRAAMNAAFERDLETAQNPHTPKKKGLAK